MLDRIKQGRAWCAACIRISSSWCHLRKSKHLEGDAKKRWHSHRHFSSVIFSVDFVNNRLDLYVVIGLLGLYIPCCGSDLRREQVIHTSPGRTIDHLV